MTEPPDEHARARVSTVRSGPDTIVVPEPRTAVRRTSHLRRAAIAATALVIVASTITAIVAVTGSGGPPERIETVGPVGVSLPAGAIAEGRWTMVPTQSAGIGAGASLHALASDGATLLLSGEKPDNGRYVVTMWRSDDGVNWAETDHPAAHDSVTAIAMHGDTALAIGAPGGANAFAWRSEDRGRHWDEIACGDVFGEPVPDSRPGAFVSGLLWRDGWWIAYGGAAGGYEGIWISRDGTQWQAALDSRSSGSIDGIVDTPDGSLMAYGVGAGGEQATIEIGWFTEDPTSWGAAVPIETPGHYWLASVAPGAGLAIGQNINKGGAATPLLRSTDGGRTWDEDPTFSSMFPDAWAWTATRAGDLDIVVGTSIPRADASGRPEAWLTVDGKTWSTLPTEFGSPTLPTTSIPQLPPTGALELVGAVGDRVVMIGLDSRLDRFYTFDILTDP